MDEKTLETILARFDESNRMMKEEFEKTNTNIDRKLDIIGKRLDVVENKVETNTKKVEMYEKEKRKRNVLIFGMEQEADENYVSLEEKVRNMIREKMEISILSTEIDSIRRFGKTQNNKRPIIMALTTWKRKMELLTNGKKLKNSGYSIKEDFPPEVQKIRKDLYEEMMKHRREGKKAYIRYDKLIISGNEKEDNEVEDVNMEESGDEARGIEGTKRKAESEPEREIVTDKITATPNRKKYLTHQRSTSTGSKVNMNQSRLEHFFNSESSSKQPETKTQ
ncbi:hypothetical protein M8J76_006999 [Diaphorina citri]|nr:hypothetical protein M8J76_006999 [Diaphorina citri]